MLPGHASTLDPSYGYLERRLMAVGPACALE